MHVLPEDERFLHRALKLAAAAVGLASPNPTVGCVLADALGNVLGEGAHHYDARDHAEIIALKEATAAGRSVRGATAFVTLEPCTVQGRTGPCADALIAAGIARCVVATVDPNPAVCGRGVARLRAAGVEVAVAAESSAIGLEARRLNDAFACSIQSGRPLVTLKAALSVDGKLAPPAKVQTVAAPHWLTGEAARQDVQWLRHSSDAILTGIGTVLADDPSLTDRTGLPRRRALLRVVLDSTLRMPLAARLVQSAAEDTLIFCGVTANEAKKAALEARGVEVVRVAMASERLNLRAVLAELHQRKVLSVLLEAGAAANAAFLHEKLVDKVVLYYAESELGVDALPFAVGGVSPFELQQQLSQVKRASFRNGITEDVRVAGILRDPWRRLNEVL